MEAASRQIIRHAHQLAREIEAQAVVVYADALAQDQELRQLLSAVNYRTVLATRSKHPPNIDDWPGATWVSVPDVHMTRTGRVKVAILICLAKELLRDGDRVVCVTGLDGSNLIDTVMVLNLGAEPELLTMRADLTLVDSSIRPEVFERTFSLAMALAVEGREGRPVGTIFVLGDVEAVQANSSSLILNPFHGYPAKQRNILDAKLEETIKEYSALDGAFLVRGDGIVEATGLRLHSGGGAELPKGLGTRHAAAAAITVSTKAVAICISQSTGTVSVFKSGHMMADIHKAAGGNRMTS